MRKPTLLDSLVIVKSFVPHAHKFINISYTEAERIFCVVFEDNPKRLKYCINKWKEREKAIGLFLVNLDCNHKLPLLKQVFGQKTISDEDLKISHSERIMSDLQGKTKWEAYTFEGKVIDVFLVYALNHSIEFYEEDTLEYQRLNELADEWSGDKFGNGTNWISYFNYLIENEKHLAQRAIIELVFRKYDLEQDSWADIYRPKS